jgi:hypothetical protein
MKKEYTDIAYTIGRDIKRRTSLDDPLSDRLLDLLDRLRERGDLENTPRPAIEQAPTETSFKSAAVKGRPKRRPLILSV